TTTTQKKVWAAIGRGEIPPPDYRFWMPPRIPAIRYLDAPPWVEAHEPEIIQHNELPLTRRSMYFPLDLRHELYFRDPERGIRGGIISHPPDSK
ncbi:MAG: hypothetical protein PF795_05775, partial [Kiritimatiellae bacterium]|nr:hypothetical protein [Kiritimatiellia bacterium]